MEVIIATYFVIAIAVGFVFTVGTEDLRWIGRAMFWPLYLLAFVYRDIRDRL